MQQQIFIYFILIFTIIICKILIRINIIKVVLNYFNLARNVVIFL